MVVCAATAIARSIGPTVLSSSPNLIVIPPLFDPGERERCKNVPSVVVDFSLIPCSTKISRASSDDHRNM
jgi:hypothetical protein